MPKIYLLQTGCCFSDRVSRARVPSSANCYVGKRVLSITEGAAKAIRAMMERRQMPEGCRLRIAAGADGSRLAISVAGAPKRGDSIVEADGARVFVEKAVTTRVDGKVLDTGQLDDGRVHFRLVAA